MKILFFLPLILQCLDVFDAVVISLIATLWMNTLFLNSIELFQSTDHQLNIRSTAGYGSPLRRLFRP